MKKMVLILLIMLFVFPLVGCNEIEKDNCLISSYMIDNTDSEDMLNSESLFAYEISISDNVCLQIIYVWNNLLRRELRNDLIQIYNAIPNKDKDVIIVFGENIIINDKDISFKESSELSLFVLKSIFLTETKMNCKELRDNLNSMIIRLETLEEFGDSEVIAIQTITKKRTNLKFHENRKIIYVNNLGDIK